MDNQTSNNKLVIIKYNSLDDLFEREEAMKRTLLNNLEREGTYDFVGSYISIQGTKYLLNLEIAPVQ